MSCVTLEGAVMLVKGVTLGRDVRCYSRGGCHASEGCYPRKGCQVLL